MRTLIQLHFNRMTTMTNSLNIYWKKKSNKCFLEVKRLHCKNIHQKIALLKQWKEPHLRVKTVPITLSTTLFFSFYPSHTSPSPIFASFSAPLHKFISQKKEEVLKFFFLETTGSCSPKNCAQEKTHCHAQLEKSVN